MWYRKRQDKKKFNKYKKMYHGYTLWSGPTGYYHRLDFKRSCLEDWGNLKNRQFMKKRAHEIERNYFKKLDTPINGNQIHKVSGRFYFSNIL